MRPLNRYLGFSWQSWMEKRVMKPISYKCLYVIFVFSTRLDFLIWSYYRLHDVRLVRFGVVDRLQHLQDESFKRSRRPGQKLDFQSQMIMLGSFLDYTRTDTFCLLYHQKTKKYKVLHVWPIYERGCEMEIGCEILTVHNAFKDLVESSWKRIHVPVGFESWESYMLVYVTIVSKLLFWNVRKHKYMVKFDIRTQTFTKIEHMKEEWDVGSRRFLFEDRGQLLMFYITTDATVYILNDESRWEYVKKFDHSEDWNRMDGVGFDSPFLSSSALLERFLLYKKPRSQHASVMDISFRKAFRGDTLSHSFSARSQRRRNN